MRTKLLAIAFAVTSLFIFQSQAQTADSGFPKGELSTAKNHTGNIWLSELNVGDSTFDPSIAMASYDPGAKLDWHGHPGGQIILILEGTGYYQERGKPLQEIPAPIQEIGSSRKGSLLLSWSIAIILAGANGCSGSRQFSRATAGLGTDRQD